MSDTHCDQCGGPFSSAHADPQLRTQLTAKNAEIEALTKVLVEVGDFLADDCVENHPFDRLPGSFADEADRLLKLIKASVEDAPQ
jgi:hypothetical protein